MNTVNYIIYSDLDGTLLDHYTYSTAAADNTLKRLETANIPVILNTSKTFAEVEQIHQSLELTSPFIVENGAAIYIPKNTFADQPVGTTTTDKYWVKTFCKPITHWLNLLTEQANRFSTFYLGFSSLADTEIAKITGLTVAEAAKAKQRQFGEPIQWLGNDSTKQAFINHMLDLGANVVQGGRFLHVSDFCDKGQALLWLTTQYQEDYKIHFDNPSVCTIALGDGENDTAMLEAAEIAVQVKSPVHSFPTLSRQKMTVQTAKFGPEGWSMAIEDILSTQLNQAVHDMNKSNQNIKQVAF